MPISGALGLSSPINLPVLGPRDLNRATLKRQLLLERSEMAPAAAIDLLVGMQAQVPTDPYTGLWTRLSNFDPHQLGRLLVDRSVVRTPVMRTTVHLVSARDALMLRGLVDIVLTRTLQSTSFGKNTSGMDLKELVATGRRLMEERPRTKAELRAELGPLWPERDANSLAYAVHYLTPLIQVPPRGVWGSQGQATWTTYGAWLGAEPDPTTTPDEMVMRYLKAYGPAAVMDIQAWCGLSKLSAVVERHRSELVTFRDERGKELFDLPDAPRPGPDTPSPVRYLPEYDNVLLGFKDRTRFMPGELPPLSSGHGGYFALVLIDGLCGAIWSLKRAGGTAELLVEPFVSLSAGQRAELEEEGAALLGFIASDMDSHRIRIEPLI